MPSDITLCPARPVHDLCDDEPSSEMRWRCAYAWLQGKLADVQASSDLAYALERLESTSWHAQDLLRAKDGG